MMQRHMATSLISGIAIGLVMAGDLHWIGAGIAAALYLISCFLAHTDTKGGGADG